MASYALASASKLRNMRRMAPRAPLSVTRFYYRWYVPAA